MVLELVVKSRVLGTDPGRICGRGGVGREQRCLGSVWLEDECAVKLFGDGAVVVRRLEGKATTDVLSSSLLLNLSAQ